MRSRVRVHMGAPAVASRRAPSNTTPPPVSPPVASTMARARTVLPSSRRAAAREPASTVARPRITRTASGTHRRMARSKRTPVGSPAPPAASPTGTPSTAVMRAETSSRRRPSTGGNSTAPRPSHDARSRAATPSAMPSVSKREAVSRKVSPSGAKGALTMRAPSVSAMSLADHEGCVARSTTPTMPVTAPRSSSDARAPCALAMTHPATVT